VETLEKRKKQGRKRPKTVFLKKDICRVETKAKRRRKKGNLEETMKDPCYLKRQAGEISRQLRNSPALSSKEGEKGATH